LHSLTLATTQWHLHFVVQDRKSVVRDYITDGKSAREFKREGEEIKPELRTQKQARAKSRREQCVQVVIPAAVCEHSLRHKELVGGHRESKREIGPQLPSTQDGKKGGKWATVA